MSLDGITDYYPAGCIWEDWDDATVGGEIQLRQHSGRTHSLFAHIEEEAHVWMHRRTRGQVMEHALTTSQHYSHLFFLTQVLEEKKPGKAKVFLH